MQDQEIRTLTLRFASIVTAHRFMDLAGRHGYKPALSHDNNWHIVTTFFQNKQARTKLIQAWAKESMSLTE
jgi:hypothetical protein